MGLLRPFVFLLVLCAVIGTVAIHTAELRAAEAARNAAVGSCKPIAPNSNGVTARLARHTVELERFGGDCP